MVPFPTVRHHLSRLACLLLACLSLITAAGAQVELAGMTFLRRGSSQPLRATMTAAFNPGFFRAVGGVAFAGVAEGDGLQIEAIAYDPERPDGQRLVLEVSDVLGQRQQLTADLHDWELVPIARFAASDTNACVTLFGSLDDESLMSEVAAEGQRVISYHPAFEDTLMGLRLLQGDLLAFVPQASDLFKVGGRYVMGGGEKAPTQADVARNRSHFQAFTEWLIEQPRAFSSYVVCDKGQQVTFTAEDNRLVLDGHPIWDCWTYSDEYIAFHEGVAEDLMMEMFMDSMQLSERELEARWTEQHIETRRAALEAELGGAPDPDDAVEPLTELTGPLSRQIRMRDGLNPVVYEALGTTMRYSSLFRAARAEAPAAFKDLLRSLEGIKPRPPVDTPNIMPGA